MKQGSGPRPIGKIKRVDPKLFTTALTCFAIFYTIHMTYCNEWGGLIKALKYLCYGMTILCSIAAAARNLQRTPLNLFFASTLLLVAALLYVLNENFIVASVALIVSATGLPLDYIIKRIRNTGIACLTIIFFLAKLQIIPDEIFARPDPWFGSGVAHGFGFYYYTGFAYPAMGIILAQLYLWRSKLNLLRLGILLALSVLLYLCTYTRLQLIACVVVILGFWLIQLLKLKFKRKVFLWIGLILYPALGFSAYYTTVVSPVIGMMQTRMANEMLSGRLDLNDEAFLRYQVKPFGQKIETVNSADEYFYIDSGYIAYLLRQGLVFTVIFLLGYSFIFYKTWKARNPYLYFMLAFFAFVSLINDFLINIFGFPFIFALFDSVDNLQALPQKKNGRKKVAISNRSVI